MKNILILIGIGVSLCYGQTASFTISDDTICINNCITITNTSVDADSYSWTFNGGTPATASAASPGTVCFDTPGSYTIDLEVTNTSGTNNFSLPIFIDPLPILVAGNDTIIESGQSANLFTTGDVGTINWSPSESLDCSTCPTVIATPNITTNYIVSLTNENGCISTRSVNVEVELSGIVAVPNTFSPNGDNLNDILYVKGDDISEMSFKIYNRYGQFIFESNAQSIGWDGTFNGQVENPGTFIYTVDYTLFNGVTGTINGNVTLVR